MRSWCLFLMLIPAPLVAQEAAPPQSGQSAGQLQAWAREPKELPFQNDSQWEDNRWQSADVGPFLSGSMAVPGGLTLKGLAIRVGAGQQATVCFDTARCRLSAAWSGGFLQFDPRRFGLIGRLTYAGTPVLQTEELAGWAYEERFQPTQAEITDPDIEAGYTAKGASVVRLPKDWAAFRGIYTSGQRVVLSYTVGQMEVLESPWYVEVGEHAAVVRSVELGPSATTQHMLLGQMQQTPCLLGDPHASLEQRDGRYIVRIAPHTERVRYKVLLPTQAAASAEQALRHAAGSVEDLSQLIQSDQPRWPEILETQGATTEVGGPYVIDSLTLPFDNPYGALLFTSGHDFFTDGSAAICTVHGDVWVVTGIDRRLQKLRWKRYATGLFQPLGLKIVRDKVYVLGRDQITRLHDRNQDGEADYYENFNNDLLVTPRTHDFVTCLDTDPAGNFYFIHAKTGVMRVSADGAHMTSIADGFRNPNGMAVSPTGLITAAPQQGTWTPESSLIVVKEQGYYGFGGPRISPERPLGWDLPMCFIPRAMDNSGGAQVWVEGDRWGPLAGRMVHLSFGQCRLLLALTEQVDGTYQGGTIAFPTTPGDFESGIMRGRFNPHDGQLYVSGLRGWQTRAIRDGCFQRVRYTGGAVRLPIDVKTFANGIRLTFAESLDRGMAENPENYFVEQWNYRWTDQYGSPDFSVAEPERQGRDEVPVHSATLLEDGRSIFLEMPDLQPVMQMQIHWLLNSQAGERFENSFAHTINKVPALRMPADQLTRPTKTELVSADELSRLRPGLALRIATGDAQHVDYRVTRLAEFQHALSASATPFLPPGPLSIACQGTLRVPQSGFYDFRIMASGTARMWINDVELLDSEDSQVEAQQVLLRKGHNRLRIETTSPPQGKAQWQLQWQGHKFTWEPLPPDVLFHDSGLSGLQQAHQRRQGRQLFADHQCARCHLLPTNEAAMLEVSLAAPDLSEAGGRWQKGWLQHWLLNPQAIEPLACMPSLLGEGPSARQAAADLAAFLVGLAPSAPVQPSSQQASAERDPEAVRAGARLFESLGCIACHHFQSVDGVAAEIDAPSRRSLQYCSSKFTSEGLLAFLRKPAAFHAASRMPDFELTEEEAQKLVAYVQEQSAAELAPVDEVGQASRGRELFHSLGCRQCHKVDAQWERLNPQFALSADADVARWGCLAEAPPVDVTDVKHVPQYGFTAEERRLLTQFVRQDLNSLNSDSPIETCERLIERLQCTACHDRDGVRAARTELIMAEGSGQFPEVLPNLTWAGEKFQLSWTQRLLAGSLDYKPRPWLQARMPAYPRYAEVLAHGLAAQHVDIAESQSAPLDPQLVSVGEQLTLHKGLDCRQCHAIGLLPPRGDQETQISQGINFSYIGERLRPAAYLRFMLDPPRYDPNTKMIRLSEDGRSTKLREFFDSDARQQFSAVWQYIQSLAPPE